MQHSFHTEHWSGLLYEIAKLRAGRMLWSNIVSAYKPAAGKPDERHCETSEFNMTVFDPYVNLLRTQTEAMSHWADATPACSTLWQPFRKAGEFSERIAHNNSYYSRKNHISAGSRPGAGSYYIENLTESIANEAWKLFVEVESKGGYFSAVKKALYKSWLRNQVLKTKSCCKSQEVLLGTNQYQMLQTMKDAIEETAKACCGTSCSEEQGGNHSSFQSCEFEHFILLLKGSKKTKTFMLTYGNLAMRLIGLSFR